jgi:hypothetical protein
MTRTPRHNPRGTGSLVPLFFSPVRLYTLPAVKLLAVPNCSAGSLPGWWGRGLARWSYDSISSRRPRRRRSALPRFNLLCRTSDAILRWHRGLLRVARNRSKWIVSECTVIRAQLAKACRAGIHVCAFPRDAAAVLAADRVRVIERARQIVRHGLLLVTSSARSARRVP